MSEGALRSRMFGVLWDLHDQYETWLARPEYLAQRMATAYAMAEICKAMGVACDHEQWPERE